MTENEIIEILQTEKACVTRAMKNECNRDCYNCDLCEEGKDILTVYDAVINALDEIQQYRELGTVEEILKVFNNQRDIISMQHETVKQYRAIGTIDEFKALKEKSVAKKIVAKKKTRSYLGTYYYCPNCNARQLTAYTLTKGDSCCKDCGQKLDWE